MVSYWSQHPATGVISLTVGVITGTGVKGHHED
jgi:hypothetical protein